MRMVKIRFAKLSQWQLVFSQSKANGAHYRGEQLPNLSWEWPKNTYLQRRLKDLGCKMTGDNVDRHTGGFEDASGERHHSHA